MRANLSDLFIIFDEILPSTKESEGVYWLEFTRPDEIAVIFSFSSYENYVDIIIKNKLTNFELLGLSLKGCSSINTLDLEKKCLEVVHDSDGRRCFLSLLNGPILDYNE